MNVKNAKELPYFERLPRYALPALAAAWDTAKNRQFGTHAIYLGFCRDMEYVGHAKPTKPEMSDWIGKVEKGLIPRPLATTEDKRDEVAQIASDGEPVTAPVVPEADDPVLDVLETEIIRSMEADTAPSAPSEPALSKPFFGPDFPAEDAPIAPMTDTLRSVSGKMLDQLVAEFEANARRHATTIVVGILRDLAAEMERAA